MECFHWEYESLICRCSDRSLSPPQSVKKDAGPHVLCIAGTTVGPISHETHFSTGWNHKFHPMLGFTDACVSGWARPVWQLWPLGKTCSGSSMVWLWAWFTEGRLSLQMHPRLVGELCVRADRPSAPGRMQKVSYQGWDLGGLLLKCITLQLQITSSKKYSIT